MNNIQPFALYIDNLFKTAGITPTSHHLMQKRILKRLRSSLRQPRETMQSIQERSFQDNEKERAVPTWLDIAIDHLQNYGNIKSP